MLLSNVCQNRLLGVPLVKEVIYARFYTFCRYLFKFRDKVLSVKQTLHVLFRLHRHNV